MAVRSTAEVAGASGVEAAGQPSLAKSIVFALSEEGLDMSSLEDRVASA